MSLKIIKLEPGLARIALVAAAILCATTTWFFVKWNFANAVAWQLDSQRPESKVIADGLTQIAPNDPQTHAIAALVFEKTFDPDDLARSLSEHEMAAALSPHDYMMWLILGKARSLNGDAEGADAAYRKAMELAPNYASIQWIYGNTMLREGKTDEGFALIAKAVASNQDYSASAVGIAIQIFDGDITQVRQQLGDIDATNSALAASLSGLGRYDEAFEAWSKLAAADKAVKFKELGVKLTGQFAAAKQYQLATRVAADLQLEDAEKPVIGQISNGGFENGVKLNGAGTFEWQVAVGPEPQIGLSDTQKRSGKYCLWISFNSFETAAFRTVSQTVAVVPGAAYEFEVFYRSDVKTSSALKWEIADAATGSPIAKTEALALAGDWTPLRVRFTLPAGGDGVIIRFVREGCAGPSCPTNGRLSFDDFSLRRL